LKVISSSVSWNSFNYIHTYFTKPFCKSKAVFYLEPAFVFHSNILVNFVLSFFSFSERRK
jgi:hypothetical protein